MFSSRLPASLAHNRISIAVDAARARAQLIDLTESNPTVVGLRYPADAIRAALAAPAALTYEPTPKGLPAARAAVAAYYARHELAVGTERITLTASTREAYGWLFKLLCDPGDDVLVPSPSYPLFDYLAALESVRPVPYPLRYHGGWFVDVDEVRRALTPRTRAILVVNPNNPTGSFLKRDEAGALAALAAERDLALISDEVFADYGFAPDPARVTTLAGESRRAHVLPQRPVEARRPAAAQARLDRRRRTGRAPRRGRGAPRAHRRHLPLGRRTGAACRAGPARRSSTTWARRSAPACATTAPCSSPPSPARRRSSSTPKVAGRRSCACRRPRARRSGPWRLLDDGVLVHPGFFFDLPPTTIVISLLVAPAALAAAVPAILRRCMH